VSLASLAALLISFFSAGSASAQNVCNEETFKTCPSQCVARCETDDDFLEKNAKLCVSAIKNTKADAASCPKPEVRVDCSTFDDPIDKIFCETRFPSCTKSTKKLENDFRALRAEVNAETLKFKGVLETDFTATESEELLCEFKQDELRTFYNQASADSKDLKNFGNRFATLDACAGQINTWTKEYKFAGTTNPRLRDSIIGSTLRKLDEMKETRAALELRIRKIESSEPVLQDLLVLHRVNCTE